VVLRQEFWRQFLRYNVGGKFNTRLCKFELFIGQEEASVSIFGLVIFVVVVVVAWLF